MTSAPAASTPLTIAVIKPCCIGDCVMALPAIHALSETFPFAHIHAFTGRHSAPVFRASADVSRVYLTPDQMTPARVPGLAWNLRTAGHDWIVVLDRSRLIQAAARSASPARLVTPGRSKTDSTHEIDVYLDIVERAGVKAGSRVPHLTPDEDSMRAADEALANVSSPFAVLHPGGAENPGTAMPGKRWPVDRFAAVARQLAIDGLQIVLTGGPGDSDLAQHLADELSVPVVNLTGALNLMGTAAVISKAAVYVGCDTGVSHLAAAVGTPTVAIFGPTNPDRYGPRGDNVKVVAPERSRSLPDADLRNVSLHAGRPSTSEVDVGDVMSAIFAVRSGPAG